MSTHLEPPEIVVTLRRFAMERHRYITHLARSLGLSRTEFEALDYIQEAGAITPAKLADLLCVTGGAVTSLVDKLEDAGYVRREVNKRDRRSILLTLTDEAEGLGERAFGGFVADIDAAASRMTAGQRAATIEFLKSATAAAISADRASAPKPPRRTAALRRKS
jgi:DNA-binding MarR family transcriptional regulator